LHIVISVLAAAPDPRSGLLAGTSATLAFYIAMLGALTTYRNRQAAWKSRRREVESALELTAADAESAKERFDWARQVGENDNELLRLDKRARQRAERAHRRTLLVEEHIDTAERRSKLSFKLSVFSGLIGTAMLLGGGTWAILSGADTGGVIALAGVVPEAIAVLLARQAKEERENAERQFDRLNAEIREDDRSDKFDELLACESDPEVRKTLRVMAAKKLLFPDASFVDVVNSPQIEIVNNANRDSNSGRSPEVPDSSNADSRRPAAITPVEMRELMGSEDSALKDQIRRLIEQGAIPQELLRSPKASGNEDS
jgi:hypothetical protein